MPKNTFQDILPPEKRSIRDIPLPVRKNAAAAPKPPKKEVREEPEETIEEEEYEYKEPATEKKSYKKVFLFIIIVVIVLAVIFFSTSLFSGATVKVTPHSAVASIDVHYTANRDSSTTSLHYDLITVEKEGQKVVDASSTATVSIKAKGKVILYNNFSTQRQGLVKNTRLESTGGLIFRTDSAVTIPAKAGTGIPGAVEVSVTADVAGDKYNLGPSDFTIPGFKDDAARYAGFYGRSKTPLAGGFVGVQGTITEKDRQAALASLTGELQSSLTKEIVSQKPDSFVLYDDAIVPSTQILPDETVSTDPNKKQVAVKEKMVLYGIIFNKQELSDYVAANSSGASIGTPGSSDVTNLEKLSMTLLNKPNFSATTSTSINFSLKGSPTIVSHIDIDKLRTDLAGKTLKSAQNLLSTAYPMIEKMEFIIRPFWKSTLPTDPNQMVIDIITP